MPYCWRPDRILYRITLPFTLLFASITLLTWAASVLLTGHYFDKGLRMQLLRVASGISQSSFLLNPNVLRQVKGMVDADIVLLSPSGQVLSSTIDEKWLHEVPSLSLISGDDPTALQGRVVTIKGQDFRVVSQEVTLPDRGRAYLSLWQSTAIADSFKNSIFLITGAIALLGIISLAVAGYVVARSISIPVVQLANITERVAHGDFSSRVEVQGRRDEVAMLGHSFNAMINQLQESERKLVETEKLAAAGQLAAGVAHEIKNPLTAIKMFVQVLQGRMTADPKNLETLDVVLSEINRLDGIVEQIVQRARSDEAIRLEMCQPVPLLQEVLAISRESFRVAKVVVESNFSSDIPLLPLDRARIKQVFWNIILNAKDAMPNGGKLFVSGRKSASAAMVELIFEDTGVGLVDLDPEVCFRSFFTTKPEGLGLGLSMSRKIVEKHGGSLQLQSRSEGGARVVLTLPVIQIQRVT